VKPFLQAFIENINEVQRNIISGCDTCSLINFVTLSFCVQILLLLGLVFYTFNIPKLCTHLNNFSAYLLQNTLYH
jgi:hypothetical protein